MKYTSFENIARRLRGRLEVTETNGQDPNLSTTLGYSSSIGGQEVDSELVEQIAKQKELGFIDLILGQIYELPLKNYHFIVQETAECLICGEILRVHFQGSNLPQLGADVKGMATDYFSQAYQNIAMLTAGHNIHIPVMPGPAPRTRGMMQQHSLFLPGEKYLTNRPDTITPNISVVGPRSKNRVTEFDLHECGPGSLIDGKRAYGQEPIRHCNTNPFI